MYKILFIFAIFTAGCKKEVLENSDSVSLFVKIESHQAPLNLSDINLDEEDIPLIAIHGVAGVASSVLILSTYETLKPNRSQNIHTKLMTYPNQTWKKMIEEAKPQKNIVAHVGVEFGDAIVGGAGTVANNLAVATNQNGTYAIGISPYFDFQKEKSKFIEFAQLQHPFKGQTVTSKVYLTKYKNTLQFVIDPDPKMARFSAKHPREIHSARKAHDTYYFDIASSALAYHLDEVGLPIKVFQAHHSGMAPLALHAVKRDKDIRSVLMQHDIVYNKFEIQSYSKIDRYFKGLYQGSVKSHLNRSPLASNSKFSDYVIPVSQELKKMSTKTLTSNWWISSSLKRIGDRYKAISNGILNTSYSQFFNQKDLLEDKRKAKIKLLSKTLSSQELSNKNLVQDLRKPIFLYVGRWSREKGINDLKKAAKYIGDRGQLMIMTNASENDKQLKELKKIKNITIVNGLHNQQKNDLGKTIRAAADVALVPSRAESFGMVALEGILNGQIVVSTGREGLGEVLKDDKGFQKERHYNHLKSSSLNRAIDNVLNIYQKDVEKNLAWRNYKNFREKYDYSGSYGPMKSWETVYGFKILPGSVFQIENENSKNIIRFIHSDDMSQIKQKISYIDLLRKSGFEITNLEDLGQKVDVNFHFKDNGSTDNAKENWAFIDQKWLGGHANPTEYLKKIDHVFCQDKNCLKNIEELNNKTMQDKLTNGNYEKIDSEQSNSFIERISNFNRFDNQNRVNRNKSVKRN